MQERLAHIPVQKRDPADTCRRQHKCRKQERFPAPETAHLVQLVASHLRKDHARRHKEYKLHQRMVQHMEERAVDRHAKRLRDLCGSFTLNGPRPCLRRACRHQQILRKQRLHTHTRQYEADL